jgi:hypothetical protein
MGMVLAIAPMRVEHHDGAPLQGFTPDCAREIIHTPDATTHQRAQQDRRVVREHRAEHGGDREDDVARDHPRVEHLAHLAHPVVHVDFGTPQAQRRCAAHRHEVLPLATVQAAVCNVAHLLRVPTREHLGHQTIIVGRPVARMGVGEPIPVLSKDLCEDIPVPRGCCNHEGAPTWRGGRFTVSLLYHTSLAQSTLSSACPEAPSPPSLVLEPWGLPGT